MIDRRGFIGLMFGAAAAPKAVLDGLITPAPVMEAMEISYIKWTNASAKEIHEILAGLDPDQLMMLTVEVGFKTMTGPIEAKVTS